MLTLSRLAALVVVVVLALAVSPPGRSTVAAGLLLPHFFPGDIPRPLSLITSPPIVRTVAVPGAPGRMVADLYEPRGGERHPAMILLLGVDPLPRGDPQVTTLADGIARLGFVTVVAESDALLAGEIRPNEVDNLVALFQYVADQPSVDQQRIGFAGFCIGGVLELLAASDERIADRVAYVNAFSVYADPIDVLRAIATQSMPSPSGPVAWKPSDLTRQVFVTQVIAALPVARDRALLTREIEERTTLTTQEVEALSPAGAQVRDLLLTADPAHAEALVDSLPDAITTPLRRLSPAASASRLSAKTFLMHDQSDTYLPVSGARTLAGLLPPAAAVHYTEFRLFAHVVPGGVDDPRLFVGEMVKLVGHIRAVLETADVRRNKA